MNFIRNFKKDNLEVFIYPDRDALGFNAAENVSKKIEEILKKKSEIRIVFAAAPSQNEFLKYLLQKENIDWSKITAFHMDEYIGLREDSDQLFSKYLKDHFFDKIKFKKINYINPQNENVISECKRYSDLISENPIDIVFMGIGENGHIAFNDPPVADFDDPEIVKIVELDEACKQQQVNDGCFKNINEVPKQAFTLTIPALMSAEFLSVVVPGKNKAEAVKKTLTGKIIEDCPASILRKHENAILYLDPDSAGKI